MTVCIDNGQFDDVILSSSMHSRMNLSNLSFSVSVSVKIWK